MNEGAEEIAVGTRFHSQTVWGKECETTGVGSVPSIKSLCSSSPRVSLRVAED